MKYEIIDFRDIDQKEYTDFFVETSKISSCSCYEWLKCLNEYAGISVHCVVAKHNREPVGCFPYAIRKKYGITLYESMPFSLYGGLFLSEDCFNGIIKYFNECIKTNLYIIRINFGNCILEKNIGFMKEMGFDVIRNKAAVVPLYKDTDRLFKSYKHNIRKNINKAIREDVVVSDIEDEKELYEFYQMAKYIYEYHNSKMPYRYELYRHMFQYLVPAGIAKFSVAKRHGTIMAGGIHFFDYHQKEVFNWLTPSYRKYQQYRANTLLIHHVLIDAAQKGFNWYNLGASPDGETGLLHFKHNWGAIDREYFSFNKSSVILKLYNNLKGALRT